MAIFDGIFKTGASPYAGFMSPEMQQQMRGQQLMAIGASGLSAAGPSIGVPGNIGAGIGRGFTAAANIGQQSVGNALMLQNYKAQQAATALAAQDRARAEAGRENLPAWAQPYYDTGMTPPIQTVSPGDRVIIPGAGEGGGSQLLAQGADPGFFSSKGVEGDDRRNIQNLAPKIADGTATSDEQRAYASSYNALSQPFRWTDPATNQVYERPGMDMSFVPPPPGRGTGQLQPAPGDSGRSADTALGDPSMTQFQAESAGYADRMQDVEGIMVSVSEEGAGFLGRFLEERGQLGNLLQRSAYQEFAQGRRNWINANLRRESGAVISEKEFSEADEQYFPVPGDSAKVIEQKRQNRMTVMRTMARSSGGTYSLREQWLGSAAPGGGVTPAEVLESIPDGTFVEPS